MEPIRILYVCGGIMNRGGIESYMMNYYRNLDRDKVQIDFIVHGFEKGVYDEEILSMGGIIYNVPVKSVDYKGNLKQLRSIFKSGKYYIVHSHMDAMGMIVLREAKRCGIPVRISHSHSTKHLTNSKVKYIVNEYARRRLLKYTTDFWACSYKAGRWLYGKNIDFKIINNAIDVETFSFNREQREHYRKSMGLNDKLILGHIGTFYFYKNHSFILKVLQELLQSNKDWILLLIGKGPLEDEIKEKVKKMKLDKNVLFLGERNDIPQLMQAMDVFILPSQFEGLPVVIIESQTAGLPAIISENITNEVKLSELVQFESITENPKVWATKILDIKVSSRRKDMINIISSKGYSIKEEARKLEEMYIQLYYKNI